MNPSQMELGIDDFVYRAVFDRVPVPLGLFRGDGRPVRLNRQLLALLQLDRSQEPLILSLPELAADGETRANLVNALSANEKGKEAHVDGPVELGSGRPLHVRMHMRPLKGEKSRYVLASFRAEEGLMGVDSWPGQEGFHLLLGSATDAMIIENTDQVIIDANDRFCQITGYAREEIIGSHAGDFLTEQELLASIYRDPTNRPSSSIEMSVRHRDGREIPVEFTVSPIILGSVVNYLFIFRDISDRKRAENSLRESTQSIKKAFVAKQRQLDQISQVHARFLKNTFPPLGGLEFAAHCRPCADVGGDFYFVEELSDGRVAMCMIDVSGHGAPAATAAATTRALLSAALSEATTDTTPGDLLYKLSKWLVAQLEEEQFATIWLGLYDPGDEKLTYATAAHPLAVLWPAGDSPQYLQSAPSFPAGLTGVDPERPDNFEISFEVGDRLFVYTDGLTETSSSDGDRLDDDEFLDFLRNAEGQPIRQVPIILLMEFERHAANANVNDDVTVLVIDRMD